MRLQPVQLRDNRLVASLKLRLAADAGARAAAQVDCEGHAFDALDHRIDHIHGEIGRGVGLAIGRAHRRIDEEAQMRIVDLDDVGTGVADELHLAPQDRNAVAHKVIALRIGLGRFVRVPHALAQQGRRRQRGLDLARGDRLEKGDLAGDEARILRRELVDHDRPGAIVGGIVAKLEPMREFGDHTDVGFAAPLAVGHDVKAGVLLHSHDVADGGAHFRLVSLRRQRRPVVDEILNKGRPRHGADDGGWKKLSCQSVPPIEVLSVAPSHARSFARTRNPAACPPRCSCRACRRAPLSFRPRSCPETDG